MSAVQIWKETGKPPVACEHHQFAFSAATVRQALGLPADADPLCFFDVHPLDYIAMLAQYLDFLQENGLTPELAHLRLDPTGIIFQTVSISVFTEPENIEDRVSGNFVVSDELEILFTFKLHIFINKYSPFLGLARTISSSPITNTNQQVLSMEDVPGLHLGFEIDEQENFDFFPNVFDYSLELLGVDGFFNLTLINPAYAVTTDLVAEELPPTTYSNRPELLISEMNEGIGEYLALDGTEEQQHHPLIAGLLNGSLTFQLSEVLGTVLQADISVNDEAPKDQDDEDTASSD